MRAQRATERAIQIVFIWQEPILYHDLNITYSIIIIIQIVAISCQIKITAPSAKGSGYFLNKLTKTFGLSVSFRITPICLYYSTLCFFVKRLFQTSSEAAELKFVIAIIMILCYYFLAKRMKMKYFEMHF